jgi:hypothetical protein
VKREPPDDVWFHGDQFLVPIEDSTGGSDAFTLCPVDPAFRKFQESLTGSTKQWNDIVLEGVLSDASKGPERAGVMDAVQDWSLGTLTKKGFSLFIFEPATITIMHELTHSIAMGLGKNIGM